MEKAEGKSSQIKSIPRYPGGRFVLGSELNLIKSTTPHSPLTIRPVVIIYPIHADCKVQIAYSTPSLPFRCACARERKPEPTLTPSVRPTPSPTTTKAIMEAGSGASALTPTISGRGSGIAGLRFRGGGSVKSRRRQISNQIKVIPMHNGQGCPRVLFRHWFPWFRIKANSKTPPPGFAQSEPSSSPTLSTQIARCRLLIAHPLFCCVLLRAWNKAGTHSDSLTPTPSSPTTKAIMEARSGVGAPTPRILSRGTAVCG